MTEALMSFVYRSTQQDYFEAAPGVLNGDAAASTHAMILRHNPKMPYSAAASTPADVSPLSWPYDNMNVAETEGLRVNMQPGGVMVEYGDGAAAIQLLFPVFSLPTSLHTFMLHMVFDAVDAPAVMYVNGVAVAEHGNVFVPSSISTKVGLPVPAQFAAVTPPPVFGGWVDGGFGGLALTNRALTQREVSAHFLRCQEAMDFIDEGNWDLLWSARRGLPRVTDQTTQWLDELGQVPLTRTGSAQTSQQTDAGAALLMS